MWKRWLVCVALTGSIPVLAYEAGRSFGQIPLNFEVNRGQASTEVRFLSRGNGYILFLAPSGTTLVSRGVVLHMKLAGANRLPHISGLDELPGRSNYFIGGDPKKWHTNVPTFAKIRYAEVYSGIDLIYYGNRRQLEYDFVVAPGADPDVIHFAIAGAQETRIDKHGDLAIRAGDRVIQWKKPVVYQDTKGGRRMVQGGYRRDAGALVGFEIGDYDRSKPLVIDPILSTVFSTYLGGSAPDGASGVAVDAAGNVYVAGYTDSSDFPARNAIQPALNGSPSDVFVTKFSPGGKQLLYSTYVGGSGQNFGYGIAVDAAGYAYVTGATTSGDFPAIHSIQQIAAGSTHCFALKLNPSGSALIYSTQFGGTPDVPPLGLALDDRDQSWAIAVDASGNAYVAGETPSKDFPVVNAIQPASAGDFDAFVAKINPTGDQFIYSTFLGGTSSDGAKSIAVDASGNVYVAGSTNSADFPVANAFQTAPKNQNATGFVAKLNASGSGLVYSTYLGGSGSDIALGIAVDGSGDAYVTGETSSVDFPTVNAFQPFLAGHQSAGAVLPQGNAFITKFDATGSSLIYSTFLGGSGGVSPLGGVGDTGNSIALDASGSAYVTGITGSSDFPLAAPLPPEVAGDPGVMFVAKLSPAGNALVFGSYFGGHFDGFIAGIGAAAVDSAGHVYVVGTTTATTFPAINAVQPHYAGNLDAIVAEFDLTPAGNPVPAMTSLSPSSANINGPALMLQVSGGNFVSSSTVNWNGTALPTTFASATQLMAVISASDLAQPGPSRVNVVTPGPGGGTSRFLPFTVVGSLAPVLSKALPASLNAGGPSATINVTGQNLVSTSVVRWNGSALPTTFISSTSLNATVPASDLTTVGTAELSVFTPPIGGGTSAAIPFAILPPPMTSAGGVVNSATDTPNLVAGSLASVYGANFGAGGFDESRAFILPEPTTAAGLSVTMNGIAAPLSYVGPNQVNFQIPWELQGQTSAALVVVANGVRSQSQTVSLSMAAPAIFTVNQQGFGQAAAVIAGTSLIAGVTQPTCNVLACYPASKGETIEIYLTGLGAVTNQPATGAPALASPLSRTASSPTVTLGGISAPVTYSGLAPYFVGLYQVNVQIPQNAPVGDAVPVVLTFGGMTANMVTIALQ
jgi:uncharacterized protein (TIGR03437 family)